MEGGPSNRNREEDNSNPITFSSTWDLSENVPLASRAAFQSFDNNLPHIPSSYSDTLVGNPEQSHFDCWLRRLSIFSSPLVRDRPANSDYSVNDSHSPYDEFDPALFTTTSPIILDDNSLHRFASPESTVLLNSKAPNHLGEAAHNASSAEEDTLFDISSSNALTNTTRPYCTDLTRIPQFLTVSLVQSLFASRHALTTRYNAERQ